MRTHFAINVTTAILYVLMFALPIVGWGCSPQRAIRSYPWALSLPSILPRDPMLYSVLRTMHTALAIILFATLLHFSGAMMHALIFA